MTNRFSRKDFLEALFGEYLSIRDGFIRAMSVRNLDRRVSTRYFPKLETLAKEVYQDNQNVFFGVCPHENMKAEKSNIRYLVTLWASLDLNSDGFSGKDSYFSDMSYAAKAVRSFPVPPSIVVESGWGVHLYWLLRKVMPIESVERVEQVLTTMSEYFQCRRPIGIDSTLRLPDTFNCKFTSSVVKCGIKYLNTEFRYDFEEFEDLKLVRVLPGATRSQAFGSAASDEDFPLVQPAVAESEAALEEVAGFDRRGVVPYLEAKSAEAAFVGAETAARSVAFAPPSQMRGSAPKKIREPSDDDFIDLEDEPGAETVEVVAEEGLDSVADEIVDKVVARLTGELMERMVDEIVEKLYQRIMNSSDKP